VGDNSTHLPVPSEQINPVLGIEHLILDIPTNALRLSQ
jgi:hypothetical protein